MFRKQNVIELNSNVGTKRISNRPTSSAAKLGSETNKLTKKNPRNS